jgi:hypothetical protein
MKLILKSKKLKRLMGLKVHQDGSTQLIPQGAGVQ